MEKRKLKKETEMSNGKREGHPDYERCPLTHLPVFESGLARLTKIKPVLATTRTGVQTEAALRPAASVTVRLGTM